MKASRASEVFKNPDLQRAQLELVEIIQKSASHITTVAPSSPSLETIAAKIGSLRGRPFYYPAITSGLGNGPYVELADGSIKLDFITGIGTYFFGHGHPELLKVALQAACQDVLIQGNLLANEEYGRLLEVLIKYSNSRLRHGWLSLSGTDANESALKIVRQKTGKRNVVAFHNCFAGRTTLMAEITDNAAYRDGQPRYHEVFYVPFFDPNDSGSMAKSVEQLKKHIYQLKGDIATFIFELVQGEGGFNIAPRDFFVPLMDLCRENKIAVWIDEIQTFGRTGELFAYQKFGLEDYVDIVTIGKMLQNCAVLYTEEYNPRPNLIGGTFAGTGATLAAGRWIVEKLVSGDYLGPKGKIAKIEKFALQGLRDLQQRCPGKIKEVGGIGAMIYFTPYQGETEKVRKFVVDLFHEGLMAFYCGKSPTRVRFLLPGGVLQKEHFDEAINIVEKCIKRV